MTDKWPTEHPDADTLDLLTELVNIGVGRAASALSELLGTRIELTVPMVSLAPVGRGDWWNGLNEQQPCTVIRQRFDGTVAGHAALVFPPRSGLALAAQLAGGETMATELDSEMGGVLLEVGNIVLNGVMGSIGNALETRLEYDVPELFASVDAQESLVGSVRTGNAAGPGQTVDNGELLVADVDFSVHDKEIHGSVAILFAWGSLQAMLQRMVQTVG